MKWKAIPLPSTRSGAQNDVESESDCVVNAYKIAFEIFVLVWWMGNSFEWVLLIEP